MGTHIHRANPLRQQFYSQQAAAAQAAQQQTFVQPTQVQPQGGQVSNVFNPATITLYDTAGNAVQVPADKFKVNPARDVSPYTNPNAAIDTIAQMWECVRVRFFRTSAIVTCGFFGSLFALQFVGSALLLMGGRLQPISWNQVSDPSSASQVAYWAASKFGAPVAQGTVQLVMDAAAGAAPQVQYVDYRGGQPGQTPAGQSAIPGATTVMYLNRDANLGGDR